MTGKRVSGLMGILRPYKNTLKNTLQLLPGSAQVLGLHAHWSCPLFFLTPARSAELAKFLVISPPRRRPARAMAPAA